MVNYTERRQLYTCFVESMRSFIMTEVRDSIWLQIYYFVMR